jgi:hypothetical protein
MKRTLIFAAYVAIAVADAALGQVKVTTTSEKTWDNRGYPK